MAKQWTKEKIDRFIDINCGDPLDLLDEFPFSNDAKKQIDDAMEDEDNYTDSDVCDLILELAYNECES